MKSDSPIPHSSLFATPASLEQLDEMIRHLPASQRSVAYHYPMLAFNLAHKLTQKDVK
jgi:hypothetical protein